MSTTHLCEATTPVSPAADEVLILANPRAGSRHCAARVADLADHLRHDGFRAAILTSAAHVAERAARGMAAGTLRAIVAAGGDGTVAEIVNRTEPGTPIAVFPLGTANLLAGYLGIRSDPHDVCQAMRRGTTVQLDAGRAGQRVFMLMAGCGFDADVVQRLHCRRAGHISYWSYARPIVQSICNYNYPLLRVYYDDQPEPTLVRWAFIVNLPCYAGGLQFAPLAIGSDGLLNVSTFDRGSLFHGLRYLGHVMLGRLDGLADFRKRVARRVRIESEYAVPYQLDGDPGGMLPLDIEVLPGRLTLVVPPAAADRISARAVDQSAA